MDFPDLFYRPIDPPTPLSPANRYLHHLTFNAVVQPQPTIRTQMVLYSTYYTEEKILISQFSHATQIVMTIAISSHITSHCSMRRDDVVLRYSALFLRHMVLRPPLTSTIGMAHLRHSNLLVRHTRCLKIPFNVDNLR